jgi:hypothetical protein
MRPLSNLGLVLALTCALIGSVLGFLVGKTWVSVPDIRGEVARLQDELNQAKLNRTNTFRRFQLPRALNPSVSRTPDSTDAELSEEQQNEKRMREIYARGVEAALARTATENASLYGSVLSELGLAPEAILQVESNLIELVKEAMTAGEPMGRLAMARAAYDTNMQVLLGEEGYKQYRLFEASKPALREYEMLQKYALEKRGLSLDPAEAPVFVDLMREAGATTTESWAGPYDPLPRPVAGSLAIEQMETDYNALVDKANALLDAAVAAGLSEEYVQLLEDYYTDTAQRAYDNWVFWSKPREEREAIIQAEMAKGMGPPVPFDNVK